jgi:hypothetical protein
LLGLGLRPRFAARPATDGILGLESGSILHSPYDDFFRVTDSDGLIIDAKRPRSMFTSELNEIPIGLVAAMLAYHFGFFHHQ